MPTPRLIDSVASTTSHRDRDDLDGALARLLLQFLEARRVTVYRLFDDGQCKRVARRLAVGRSGDDLDAEDVSDLTALPALAETSAWQECVLLHDAVHFTGADGGLRSVFPIESERDVVGLLEIEAGDGLRPRDAALVGGVLRIVKNHLALLDYGERDTLTGLLNRKTFEASFDKLRARARNSSRTPGSNDPSWLGVVDIDNFKSINDTYGHLFGDEVLLLVARLMKQNFRGADQLFRFGGEEFVIVLDRATEVGAEIAFSRLCATVENYKFPQVGRVTISLGY
ncbi:MAG TPA: GGDEF domain-containing protein, partial [Burkholderiaceae bacterium]|nr:GGDEF domain-containing protein [Burkholderiaceae bacterium]